MYISVIATSYGRFELVKELVRSARAEFSGVEYEIVLVTSDPEDSEKISWLRQQPDVKLISFADRLPGKKRQKSLYVYENAGIKAAQGDWVLIINDDSAIDPGTLEGIQKGSQDYDILVLPTEIAYASQGKRAPVLGKYFFGSQSRDIFLLDFAAYEQSALRSLGWADEGYDWYGRGGDMGILAALDSNLRVGVSPFGGLTHRLDLENRRPPHPSKDFWYMKRKWHHLLTSASEPRLEIESLNKVRKPGLYEKRVWPVLSRVRDEITRRIKGV